MKYAKRIIVQYTSKKQNKPVKNNEKRSNPGNPFGSVLKGYNQEGHEKQ